MPRPEKHKRRLGNTLVEATLGVMLVLVEERSFSAKDLGEAIKAFFRDDPDARARVLEDEEIDEKHLAPSEAILQKILADRKIAGDGTAKVLHFWVSEAYSDELAEKSGVVREPFVAHSRRQFGHEATAHPKKVDDYVGRYKLYRPFHLDPTRFAAVELLAIGTENSPFDCEISGRFEYRGEVTEVVSQGKAVPHGPKLLLMMQVGDDRDANLIIFFDRREFRTGKGAGRRIAEGLWGNMIASVGTFDDASAWPCYAKRIEGDEAFEPHLLAKEQVQALPGRVRDSLARGAVYWSERDYPDPFECLEGPRPASDPAVVMLESRKKA